MFGDEVMEEMTVCWTGPAGDRGCMGAGESRCLSREYAHTRLNVFYDVSGLEASGAHLCELFRFRSDVLALVKWLNHSGT